MNHLNERGSTLRILYEERQGFKTCADVTRHYQLTRQALWQDLMPVIGLIVL